MKIGKIAFTVPALVAGLLPSTVDLAKLTQAVESSLNDLAVDESMTKGERKARIVSKDTQAEERQTIRFVARGDVSTPTRFAAYCDEIRLIETRARKVECNLVPVQIPSEYGKWIAKFDSAAPKDAPKAGNGTPATPRKRNTTVTPVVPSLAPVAVAAK